jgi:hypothetical protein
MPNWLAGLRNYAAYEGRPVKPACTEPDSNQVPLLRSKGRDDVKTRVVRRSRN